MDTDEPGENREPPTPTLTFNETTKTDSDVSTKSELKESDQPCRSLSMDSAYGTLSPESLLRDLHSQPGQSEGEETEEEEGDGEGLEAEEADTEMVEEEKEEEEEEDEEEENASLGSQLSVIQSSSKPRRRPHVQPRLHCLQRLSAFALSRSEDNLLQCVHSKAPLSHTHSLNSVGQDKSQCRDMDISSLPHSKSLSELGLNFVELISSDLRQSDDCLSMSIPSDKLFDGLRSTEDRYREPAGQCEAQNTSAHGETAPSAYLARKNELTAAGDSGETSQKKKKSPAQQHKKLTLAQLYRIRTTLVLNSTLTAS